MPQLIKTLNPALNAKIFERHSVGLDEPMTLDGTVNKTGLLLLCTIATAAYSWHVFNTHSLQTVFSLLWVGSLGGLLLAVVTVFQKTWAPVTAPVYSLLEGLALGGISAIFEVRFTGIAIQSVAMTFGVLLVMLIAYRSHVIPVTQKLRLGIVSATGAIALFYLVEIGLSFFGIHFTSINSANPIGIGFSILVVIVASLNLILDFDFIESGVEHGAPKYMEWYGAFGLMVTLVWLYLEILNLLSKLRGNK